MDEKARSGGTLGRAPLGYLNIRTIVNGQENRTVTIDEQRAPLVQWGFTAYASGDWTLKSLTAELVARGLTTVPTPRMPERPINVRHLYQILTNPYYTGVVHYKEAIYPGQHPRLIDDETFQTVQTVLASKVQGERTRTHAHYLKSTVHCGHCRSRMLVSVSTSATGEKYPYFYCAGRHSKRTDCTARSVLIKEVEDAIAELHHKIELNHELRADLEALIRDSLRLLRADSETERGDLRRQQQAIERQQRKLLEAHYNDAVPVDLLKTEQSRLSDELRQVQDDLSCWNATTLTSRSSSPMRSTWPNTAARPTPSRLITSAAC